MFQKILKIATLGSYSVHKLKRTGDTKFVDWCMDMFRMHSNTVYLLNFRMSCCTTVNHLTALHLLSICYWIARENLPMPIKWSCQNLITSGSNLRTVTLITPSKAEFHLFLYYTLDGHYWISSSNFRSAYPPDKRYRPFLGGATWVMKGYYVLKLKNMRWWVQQSTKICMVGLIVLMSSSRLKNRLIRCLLHQSEQLLDRHIWCSRGLHDI